MSRCCVGPPNMLLRSEPRTGRMPDTIHPRNASALQLPEKPASRSSRPMSSYESTPQPSRNDAYSRERFAPSGAPWLMVRRRRARGLVGEPPRGDAVGIHLAQVLPGPRCCLATLGLVRVRVDVPADDASSAARRAIASTVSSRLRSRSARRCWRKLLVALFVDGEPADQALQHRLGNLSFEMRQNTACAPSRTQNARRSNCV